MNKAFEKSDTVITVGYDLVEIALIFWNPNCDKTIVHIDFWPAEIDQDYPVMVDAVSDMADALWQINEGLNEHFGGKQPLHDINEWQDLRQTIPDDLAAEKDDESFPMKPQRILNDVRSFLAPEDIVLSDVGAHKMWMARYYQCKEPNTCLISNGFCSMGSALSGAMGAQYAAPESCVLAICGDAGFLMNVQNPETAVRIGSKMVIMVWVDGECGLIK